MLYWCLTTFCEMTSISSRTYSQNACAQELVAIRGFKKLPQKGKNSGEFPEEPAGLGFSRH